MTTVADAVALLLAALRRDLSPPPVKGESMRAAIGRAPPASVVHRLAATACRCTACRAVTALSDLTWEFHVDGVEPARPVCPKCQVVGSIMLIEEPA